VPPSAPRPPSSAERLLRAGFLVLLVAIIAFTRTDPDLWGHVRFGIDMIHDGTVHEADRYSFTSDKPWLNHEWGSEIAMGSAFLLGGNAGLFALKLAIVGGVLVLLHAALRREGIVNRGHRDLAAGLAVIVTIEQAHNIRPQLFSLLCFSILLVLLMRARDDRRALIALPPLFAVWANLHGGWIVGGAVLLLWTVGLITSAAEARRAALAYAAAGAVSLAATLLNPHGFALLAFLRATVGFGRADIAEWQPVYAVGRNVLAIWILVAALAAAGVRQRAKTRLDPARLLIVVALAVASFRVNRLLAFFGLATLFLYGGALFGAMARRATPRRAPGRAAVFTAGALAVVMILAAGKVAATQASCIAIDSRATPEPDAVRFFQAHGGRGRLLVWFDWGEYALWHLSPDLQVSLDGRRETVYSARMQDAHLRFYFDAPAASVLPRDLDADYIWIPNGLPVVERMLDDGWIDVYRGEQSVILARAAASPPAASSPAVSAGRRCFPGP
jgi:hypothetical protein